MKNLKGRPYQTWLMVRANIRMSSRHKTDSLNGPEERTTVKGDLRPSKAHADTHTWAAITAC